MRSRIGSIFGLLSCYVAMTIASRASAQIEFAPSTLELKPATETISARANAASEKSPAQQVPANDDPAPVASNAAPESSNPATGDMPKSAAPQRSSRLPHSLPTVVEPQFKNPPRPIVNPYTSASAQSALLKMPQPMQVHSVQSAPARHPIRAAGKPFQSANSEPAVSPYLSLYQNNSNQNPLLNYYTVVRPQLDQIEANKKQEAELQKLRSQVQNAAQGGGVRQASYDPAGDEGMTVSAHYMDTAQFYHTKRK